MHLAAWMYALLFCLLALADRWGFDFASEAAPILHFTAAAGFLLIGAVDLGMGRRSRLESLIPGLLAVILLGGALKLAWWPYGDQLLLLGLVGVTVVFIMLLWKRRGGEAGLINFRRITITFLPIGLVGLFFWILSYQQISQYLDRNLIAWNLQDRIEWDDFHGEPRLDTPFDATIMTNIRHHYRIEFGQLHYDVQAYFYPKHSWARRQSPALLEHERLHFDLTQVYAKRLRDYLAKCAEEPVKNRLEIEENVTFFLDRWDLAEEHYDQITSHGLRYHAQLDWQERVDSLLVFYCNVQTGVDRFTDYFVWESPSLPKPYEGSMEPVEVGSDIVDRKPYFPGGEYAMNRYFVEHRYWPSQARENDIFGSVNLEAVVEFDGSLSTIRVLQGLGHGCDEEAVRLISRMPSWHPALSNGRPVRSRITVNVDFPLDN